MRKTRVKKMSVAGVMLIAVLLAPSLWAAEVLIYGFEGSSEGWGIPDWAKASSDYVGSLCDVSQDHADQGRYALEIHAQFPGGKWAGVYVERQIETADWTPFGRLSVDVYLPPDAPAGLSGKIILTVGEAWQWTEMNRSVPLAPGSWTTIAVSLMPGSLDWKFIPNNAFRTSVHKLGVRIESDHGVSYHGPVYLDDVRLAES